MASQQGARRAAAQQRWAAFPADVQQKLFEFRAAVGGGGSLQKLQAWWAQNQVSLEGLGITADTQVDEYGATALVWATRYGRTESVRFLVDVCGANINLKEAFNNWTPLIGAAFNNEPDCVRVFLELGASPDLRDDDDGKTALEWARQIKSKECIDLLEEWVPGPTVKSALKG